MARAETRLHRLKVGVSVCGGVVTLTLIVFCRFEMDYEMRGCLGRGGFGVVYHVSNRTDGGEYAVKRIKLPTT